MKKLLTVTVLLSLLFSVDALSEFRWEKTEKSISLLNNGKTVWSHVHDREKGKPFMQVALLDGTALTRPSPYPKDYPKADHPWHLGLWWSWKFINGVNFWEQNGQGTAPVEVNIDNRADGSATINMLVSYMEPGKPPVVTERRLITVSAPDTSGSYRIDWKAVFTASGKDDVVFNKNSYGGFAYRGAAEFCGDPKKGEKGWIFTDSEGRVDGDANNKTSRWIVYQGSTLNGQAAGLAIIDHPDNPRHPSLWQTRNQYPYFNPSFTCAEDYILKSGSSLTLRYRVLVGQGALGNDRLEAEWNNFIQ